MSHYDKLLAELHAAARRGRSAPAFDPTSFAEHQRRFAKSMADVTRRIDRLVPRPKQTLTPRDRRRQAGRVMAKAFAAFHAGQISGDQLRSLEARHHLAVDALAQRGVL